MCVKKDEITKMTMEIERDNLHNSISKHGVSGEETLKFSEELDRLICDLQIKWFNKKTSAGNM